MSEVKWIKITTDMFDNRKIKHLRKMPDGNAIVLIWVMLLTMAGRCNAGGMIFLTESIPYTVKMLADELYFNENTVALALEALKQFGMIKVDGFLEITNWAEYQNIDGLDKIREQTRQRVARYRERKALEAGNVTSNVSVTDGNDLDIDIEEDKEKDKSNKKRKRFTPPTLDEVFAYCKERGNKVDPQKWWDFYASKGWKVGNNSMKDWQASVRTWEREDNNKRSPAKADPRAAQNYSQRTYSNDLVDLYNDTEVM